MIELTPQKVVKILRNGVARQMDWRLIPYSYGVKILINVGKYLDGIYDGHLSWVATWEKSRMAARYFKSTEDLINHTSSLQQQALNIMRQKNPHYGSKEDEDALANFRDLGLIGIVARISDKVQRLKNDALGKNITLKDEDVFDTILDLMNYAAIYGAYKIESRD